MISPTITTLQLIALAVAMGAVVSRLWLLPASSYLHTDEPGLLLRRRLAALWGRCAWLAIILALAELLIRTSHLSELPLPQAFPQVPVVLLETHYGTAWGIRFASLVLLVIAAAWSKRTPQRNCAVAPALLLLLIAAYAISAAGHAGDEGWFSVANLANTAHIAGGWLWGGIILAPAWLVLPALSQHRPESHWLMAQLAERLSQLATGALVIVIVAGVYQAWVQMGGIDAFWSADYGRWLAIKLALVAVMMGLGALNRYVFVPGVLRLAQRPARVLLEPLARFFPAVAPQRAVTGLVHSLRVEGMVLLAVLALAAILSEQTPPVHAGRMPHHHPETSTSIEEATASPPVAQESAQERAASP